MIKLIKDWYTDNFTDPNQVSLALVLIFSISFYHIDSVSTKELRKISDIFISFICSIQLSLAISLFVVNTFCITSLSHNTSSISGGRKGSSLYALSIIVFLRY